MTSTNHVAGSSLESSSDYLPLKGVRVLDLTRALSGPFCATLLGDLGADVVKVEPIDGDMVRGWGPFKQGTSLYHLAVNRNKRSFALDMRSESGGQLLRCLVGKVDVVVENFRPGVLEKLGLSATWLRENYPYVVVASVSGFGHVGPLSSAPAFDQIAQGMGGLMSVTGTEQSGPLRSGVPLADLLSGMFAALGICASLVGRARTGRAAPVQTSLLESVMAVLAFQAQRYLSLGEVPGPAGNEHPVIAPYGVYATADTAINLAVGTEGQWRSLCDVLGQGDFVNEPKFANGDLRNINRRLLKERMDEALGARTSREWLELFSASSVPAGPINDMAHAFAEPQVQALEIVEDVKHPDLGAVSLVRGPLRIDGNPTHVRLAPPLLGEHSREICQLIGLQDDEIDRLFQNGVISEPETERALK